MSGDQVEGTDPDFPRPVPASWTWHLDEKFELILNLIAVALFGVFTGMSVGTFLKWLFYGGEYSFGILVIAGMWIAYLLIGRRLIRSFSRRIARQEMTNTELIRRAREYNDHEIARLVKLTDREMIGDLMHLETGGLQTSWVQRECRRLYGFRDPKLSRHGSGPSESAERKWRANEPCSNCGGRVPDSPGQTTCGRCGGLFCCGACFSGHLGPRYQCGGDQ